VPWADDAPLARAIAAVAACLTFTVPGHGNRTDLAAQAQTRIVVIIGDLHLGPGQESGAEESRWHPFEDFRWRDEFIAFLKALDAEGRGTTDLVLNGDTFELVQSSTVPCRHDDARLGCTERESLERLEIVIRAHEDELRAIGAFARAGDNRVHVVPGDHDAALLFPTVAPRAHHAFDAPADRLQIVQSGGWLSSDGRVWVEHGHQLPLGAHAFASWPRPFIVVHGRDHLERPWGEQVIQPFDDRAEPKYPSVDNVAERGGGAKYVLAAEGPSPADSIPRLLRYLLTKTTWQQFRMDLDDGEVQAPVWDIAAIRRDASGFLASSLPADDPVAPLVAKAAEAGQLGAIAGELPDAAIVAICDYRAAVRRARRRMERVLTQLAGVGPPVAECPRTPGTIGPEFEDYWRSRNAIFSEHIAATLGRLRREQPAAPPFEAFVYGHTHLADRPFRPLGEAGPIVATSGAWQRTIHPVQLEALARERGVPPSTLLGTLQPEDLQPCYAFVRVAASASPRAPEQRVWRRDGQGQWTMAASCGADLR
jgi:Calcineurin-like phosphoesterase